MDGTRMVNDTPVIPSRQVREMISWRLAAEFHRRHPGSSTVIETHPGGGQYDCLTFYASSWVAHLNRVGGFDVPSNPSGARIDFEDLLLRCLCEGGFREVLDEMSRVSGFEVPGKVPPTSRETLAYRVMAFVVGAFALERVDWEWRNAREDTSGYGDQGKRDAWMKHFPLAEAKAEELRESDPFGCSLYRFWFLMRNGEPCLCFSKDAVCWSLEGAELDLVPIYQSSRSIGMVSGRVLGMIRG